MCCASVDCHKAAVKYFAAQQAASRKAGTLGGLLEQEAQHRGYSRMWEGGTGRRWGGMGGSCPRVVGSAVVEPDPPAYNAYMC